MKDSTIKKLKELNSNIDILENDTNLSLLLECKICGNKWNVSYKQYKKNPTCPHCREKKKPIHSIKQNATTEEFIETVTQIHPEYDYSKTVYNGYLKPITVICPEHGEFQINAKAFLKQNYKCAKCKIDEKIKINKEVFIETSKKVHGDKYDYSKVEYVNKNTNVCIICPEHGEFWQIPHNHKRGAGCPKCSNENNTIKKRLPVETFIKKSSEIHGDKYNYSKVKYVNTNTVVSIICPEHGEFWQTPSCHMIGQGCPKCGGTFRRSKDDFVNEANKIHNNKYDYSKVEYKNTHTKVCIVCHEKNEFGEEHGEFWQTPKSHLKGFGCRKCSNSYMDKESFIKKANLVHHDKYDYSKVEYKNNHTKVCILCHKHGEFWQVPNGHLNGQGCPVCGNSHFETELEHFFKENNLTFEYQYRNKEIFGKQSLDFFFPDINVAIECQGEQHFISSFFKSRGIEFAENHLKYVQSLDMRKKLKCKNNGIRLIYYLSEHFVKYLDSDDEYFTNKEDLLNFIKEEENEIKK